LAKAFYWQGWKTVGAVATSLVAISTAGVAIFTFFVAHQTLQANTQQQASDRFVKAVDQLGNDKSPDVRLGGIYGLEQLARDSPSDQPAVFDVLAAFVRGQAPAGRGKCTDPILGLPDRSGLDVQAAARPSVDVQAAMNAIARRNRQNNRKGQKALGAVLDLSATCLVAAMLFKDQLSSLEMSEADLRYAMLEDSDLQQATFFKANLSRADLSNANLSGALLWEANLSQANLREANLSGAALADANLSGADLWEANLSGANLSGANLNDIDYNDDTRWPDGFQPPASAHHP
jgi:hypothetical protein